MKLWAVALAVVCPAAAQVSTELDSLYQSNRWFEFRDAVLGAPQVSPFYRGELALAFHNWPEAEIQLQSAIRPGDSVHSFEAAMGLLRIYDLTGRRKEGRALLDRLDRSVQDLRRTGAVETVALRLFEKYRAQWNASSEFPDQSLVSHGPSRLLYSEVNNQLILPLKVNGAPANYSIDTGSDSCVISLAEARRLGLAVHPAPVEIDDGLDPEMKAAGIALAADLTIGNFHFRNVAFLVEKGDEEMTGILGLSVLLPLGAFRWGSDGTAEFGFPAQPANLAAANLCFGPMLLTRASLGGKALLLGLDTGSFESILFPRFARDFAAAMDRRVPLAGRTAPDGTIGVLIAGLDVGGLEMPFGPAPVYPSTPVNDESILHGWLGMDLLGQARTVTLDFTAMKLTLGGIDRAQPDVKAAAECFLSPDFRCLPGFHCIVKAAGAEPCFTDRVPVEPPPGNPVESDPGGAGNCYLTAGAHCAQGMLCRAVFDSNQSCHIESEAAAFRTDVSSTARASARLPAADSPSTDPASFGSAPAPSLTAPAEHDASATLAHAPDAREIVARSLKYESLDLEPPRDYIFVETEEKRFLRENGEAKRVDREAREVMNLYDARFTRLLRKDGQDLPPAKARAEQERFDNAVEKRKRDQAHETPQAKARREEGERKRNAEQLACDQEFLQLFHPHLTGAETVNGRPSWVVELSPIANAVPRCGDLKLLTRFKFKLWIDQAEYRWARFEGDNIAPVNWLKILVRVPPEGLHITLNCDRHEDGAWLDAELHWNITGKVLLAAGVRVDDRTTYTNYRKFQAESRVLDDAK